jgi:predicted transcriptional regulator
MTEDEILHELRSIRTLLAIDKEEEMEELTTGLSEIQQHILSLLDYSEWRPIPTSDVADDMNVGTTTIRNHRSELEAKNLIAKKGQGSRAAYRKTGLLRSAELLGVFDNN